MEQMQISHPDFGEMTIPFNVYKTMNISSILNRCWSEEEDRMLYAMIPREYSDDERGANEAKEEDAFQAIR